MGSQAITKARRRGDGAREIVGAIRRIARELRVSGPAAEGAVGLRGAQLAVLSRASEGRGASVGELAARTMTDPSSVSGVVARLVAGGLATRRRSPEDERRVEISITPAGRALLRRAPASPEERLVAAVASLPATKQAALARLLDEVVDAIRADDVSAPVAKPR